MFTTRPIRPRRLLDVRPGHATIRVDLTEYVSILDQLPLVPMAPRRRSALGG